MSQIGDNQPVIDVLASFRARLVLDLLDMTGNSHALREMLARPGAGTSHRAFDQLLSRFELEGLIVTEIVNAGETVFRVATLTEDGQDVRRGLDRRDWIDRPLPGRS